MSKKEIISVIPGIGKKIKERLNNIGIKYVHELKGKSPESLFEASNEKVGKTQDRCLLYVFRTAVYFAETEKEKQEKEKLKWWNWKD